MFRLDIRGEEIGIFCCFHETHKPAADILTFYTPCSRLAIQCPGGRGSQTQTVSDSLYILG